MPFIIDNLNKTNYIIIFLTIIMSMNIQVIVIYADEKTYKNDKHY